LLLPSCLEVDLGFTAADRFGPVGLHFRAVFGEAVRTSPAPLPDPEHLIGLAWHRVLHARSCIERYQPWQAEYWISGVRDQTLAFACLRLGAPAHYAKGADALPVAVTSELEDALVRSLELEELRRALRVAATQLLVELAATDAVQAQRAWRGPFGSSRTWLRGRRRTAPADCDLGVGRSLQDGGRFGLPWCEVRPAPGNHRVAARRPTGVFPNRDLNDVETVFTAGSPGTNARRGRRSRTRFPRHPRRGDRGRLAGIERVHKAWRLPYSFLRRAGLSLT